MFILNLESVKIKFFVNAIENPFFFILETLLRDADAAQYIEKNGKKDGRT